MIQKRNAAKPFCSSLSLRKEKKQNPKAIQVGAELLLKIHQPCMSSSQFFNKNKMNRDKKQRIIMDNFDYTSFIPVPFRIKFILIKTKLKLIYIYI